MTVDELRKAAEDYIEAGSDPERNHPGDAYVRFFEARRAYNAALTPERVLALCDDAFALKGLLQRNDDHFFGLGLGYDWPEQARARICLAETEAAFGKTDDS